eukprot:6182688-Heterocapsa_arctica.AAC.1
MGPATRHGQWKHDNRLQDDDNLGAQHEMLSEILELFGCFDQIDLVNSAGVESIVRHLQYSEFEVKKKCDAKKAPDNS